MPDQQRHGGGFGGSRIMLLTQLTQTNGCIGGFADALQTAAEAQRAAEQSQRSFDIALASYGFGTVHFHAGDPRQAITAMERGLQACASDGAQSIYAPLGALLGYGYYRAGRHDDALALCRRMLAYEETSLYHGNWPRLFGGMILHAVGDHAAALALAESAALVARKGGYPLQVVYSDLLLARLHRTTRPRTALRHADRALTLSRRMGMRPGVARALIEQGNVRQMMNGDDDARRLWRQGLRLADAIGLQVACRPETPEAGTEPHPECW
jgi:tetratricopeptide (TPR) repeat protein